MEELRQHASVIEKSTREYPELTKAISHQQEDVMQFAEAPKAPPSIYKMVHEKTYLSEALEIPDNSTSDLINDFIIAKMKSEGIKDTPEGYNTVLKSFMKELGLNGQYNGNMIVDAIYQKFLTKDMSAKDYLTFLNMLANRGMHA